MKNKYIGVFDSGIGGLTAVKELIKILPGENIVYFGDTGRVPYGTRSEEIIIKYTESDIKFLQTHDIKIIVAACGTASSVALPVLADRFDVPVIGVVEPTARAACAATANKIVGIIGTVGTIKSGKYEQAIAAIDPSVKTVSAACPLFVPLAENAMADSEAAFLIAQEYLKPILASGADTLILGCTHYPLLKSAITRVLGSVTLVDSGAACANHVREYLAAQNLLADAVKSRQYKFFVSDSAEDFTKIASIFLGRETYGAVEKIDIEMY